MLKLLAPLLCVCLGLAAETPLTPFGAGSDLPNRPIKAGEAKVRAIDCLSPTLAGAWMAESPMAGATGEAFTIATGNGTGELHIATGNCEPGHTTVRILLPGDGPANGALWAKDRASYISLYCTASKPALLTCHLLQRGKTAGSFQTGFSVKPGDWQRVMLPLTDFDLTSFAKIAGVGFRVATAAADTEVRIRDISVGSLPFSDDSWKDRRLSISINGDWHFTTDTGDQGAAGRWFATGFDDSAWRIIKSGQSWQQQGITHFGYGWYRQKIFVPKACAGTPLRLTLCPIPADDDVWFNGERVGGFSGEYKYNDWITRSYTVPAASIRYGEDNTIALRIWGGNLTFIGDKSGLIKGPLVAELDPYAAQMREPGGTAVPYQLFDLSDARQGRPLEIIFPFPAELASDAGATLSYRLSDVLGNEISAGRTPLTAGAPGTLQAVVGLDRAMAQTVYLRGRFNANLLVEDAAGAPLYMATRAFDQLSFAKRDCQPLPALAETAEETPYGTLKLVDEIDCATSLFDDPHPYLQSGGEHIQDRMPPGTPGSAQVVDILGRKARENLEMGWFAYRIGRGRLKPHTTYLLRIEYPEDKPRIAPIEIQTGQNFMDVGWKNGVGADDVYDNWPLSHAWQWYDVVVPLDDQTVGTGGTGTASAENGFWVYFYNKVIPTRYYAMWSGGPAVARMKLYEIDAERNAPVIRHPEGLPHRVLSFDWERQPDCDPADLVRYAKLMGYSAISPVIIKWFWANYSDPLNGYMSVAIDDHDYWAKQDYDPASGVDAASPIPGRKSQHVRFLEATRQLGLDYIPRFEWGGSQDLPKEAWAIDPNGQPTKPNRFAPWCGNLLNPLAWDDLKKLMDHLIKPYVQDNPQLTGALWRIRCDRMPISYGKDDIALFAKETGTRLPPGGETQWGAWASGEMKTAYDDWWHRKRADFHKRLAGLLQGYRSDLTLYYYNWDEDKFGLIQPDITAWAFVQKVVKPGPDGGRAAYEQERAARKALTAADYTYVLHNGSFGSVTAMHTNRADYGIRPELYKDAKGIEIFAPANYLCYADKPDYLDYFQTADGLAVSNVVSYDEIGARSINPKYEGNMVTPGGAPFSMALELLPYFHGDARTLNYTVYTYGRGFAAAHRRFAQAFLALPAIPGTVIDQGDPDVKVRTYASAAGTYVGVAFKGYAARRLTVRVPAKAGAQLTDLVTGAPVPVSVADGMLAFDIAAGPMQLDAFLLK